MMMSLGGEVTEDGRGMKLTAFKLIVDGLPRDPAIVVGIWAGGYGDNSFHIKPLASSARLIMALHHLTRAY